MEGLEGAIKAMIVVAVIAGIIIGSIVAITIIKIL